jgi:hypothetical protein
MALYFANVEGEWLACSRAFYCQTMRMISQMQRKKCLSRMNGVALLRIDDPNGKEGCKDASSESSGGAVQ